jgi:hypothetical protein
MSQSTTMVRLVEEYLDYRRRLGYQLRIEGQMLLEFARYADRSGHCGPLTTELAARWARLPAAGGSPLLRALPCGLRPCARDPTQGPPGLRPPPNDPSHLLRGRTFGPTGCGSPTPLVYRPATSHLRNIVRHD